MNYIKNYRESLNSYHIWLVPCLGMKWKLETASHPVYNMVHTHIYMYLGVIDGECVADPLVLDRGSWLDLVVPALAVGAVE